MTCFKIRIYAEENDLLLATVNVPASKAATLAEACAYADEIWTPKKGLWHEVVDLEEEAFHATRPSRRAEHWRTRRTS